MPELQNAAWARIFSIAEHSDDATADKRHVFSTCVLLSIKKKAKKKPSNTEPYHLKHSGCLRRSLGRHTVTACMIKCFSICVNGKSFFLRFRLDTRILRIFPYLIALLRVRVKATGHFRSFMKQGVKILPGTQRFLRGFATKILQD